MNALQQKMIVRSEIDIISARMAIREFARNCGFGSRDQACISLVSASIANILKLGKDFDATGIEILMEYCGSGQRHGVRVSCIKHYAKMLDQEVTHGLKGSFLLVDDIRIKPISLGGMEVTVTKWDSSYKG